MSEHKEASDMLGRTGEMEALLAAQTVSVVYIGVALVAFLILGSFAYAEPESFQFAVTYIFSGGGNFYVSVAGAVLSSTIFMCFQLSFIYYKSEKSLAHIKKYWLFYVGFYCCCVLSVYWFCQVFGVIENRQIVFWRIGILIPASISLIVTYLFWKIEDVFGLIF